MDRGAAGEPSLDLQRILEREIADRPQAALHQNLAAMDHPGGFDLIGNEQWAFNALPESMAQLGHGHVGLRSFVGQEN